MDNAVIRPYLQAFNFCRRPGDYIRVVKAVLEAAVTVTFWNAGGNYDMVKKAAAGGGMGNSNVIKLREIFIGRVALCLTRSALTCEHPLPRCAR
jgi:hypothetical protein